MNTAESRSKVPGKFQNVLLEKNSWSDRVRNEILHKSQGGQECPKKEEGHSDRSRCIGTVS